MPSAIVIGAGLAGLTTALRLRQAGWQVTVLEAADDIGGRTRTVTKLGYRFDSGALGFGTVYADMMALVDELGLRNRIVRSSTTVAVLRDGRLHEIDSARKHTAVTSRFVGVRSKLKLLNLVVDVAKVRRRIDIRDLAAAADVDDETIEAYAHRRLNDELLEYLIEPVVRLINLVRADQVSKLEVFNSLSGLLDTTLVHIRGGIEVLTEALARDLLVRRGTTVTQVVRQEDSVVVTAVDPVGSQVQLLGDYCIFATRLPEAITAYPDAKEALAPLADSIEYSHGLCIHLGYSASSCTSALSILMPPSEDQDIAVIFLEHNKAPDRAPAEKSMVTVVLDGVRAKALWDEDDALLVERFAPRVERILPSLRGALEMTQVTRWPLGLTKPHVGIYRAMRAVNSQLDPTDRIQFVGDYRSVAGQNSAVAWANKISADLIAHEAASGVENHESTDCPRTVQRAVSSSGGEAVPAPSTTKSSMPECRDSSS